MCSAAGHHALKTVSDLDICQAAFGLCCPQVQHYLSLFISEMEQLFDRHKAIAGQKDVKLHIL